MKVCINLVGGDYSCGRLKTKKEEYCAGRGVVETNIFPAGAPGEFNQNSFAATEREGDVGGQLSGQFCQ